MTWIRPVLDVRKFQKERGKQMRYTQPKITGTYSALAAIKSDKIPDSLEVNTGNFTNGASYQADE